MRVIFLIVFFVYINVNVALWPFVTIIHRFVPYKEQPFLFTNIITFDSIKIAFALLVSFILFLYIIYEMLECNMKYNSFLGGNMRKLFNRSKEDKPRDPRRNSTWRVILFSLVDATSVGVI